MTKFGNGWSENVYLDTDIVLALLKVDDWLTPVVNSVDFISPKTSVATAIEVQYVMENEWERTRLTKVHRAIADEGIDLVPLTTDAMDEAGKLRSAYNRVNVFDGVHLGVARTLDEPIVSTDTLYPDIEEIDHVDPRDFGSGMHRP